MRRGSCSSRTHLLARRLINVMLRRQRPLKRHLGILEVGILQCHLRAAGGMCGSTCHQRDWLAQILGAGIITLTP